MNEAVRNNPRKFPEGYVFELTKEDSAALRSKISTIEVSPLTIEQVNGKGRHSKYNFKAFTRKDFGEVLSDIVMPDLQTSETESSLEINFFIGKIKHTVKRVRKDNGDK